MTGRRYALSIAVVATLGAASLSTRWASALRPEAPEMRATHTITVHSGADSGPGTLREAIYAAAQADQRVRIELLPSRIVLRTPLPPIVGRDGVVIDATERGTVVDGAALAAGAVLDIIAPTSTLVGLSFSNAREEAVRIRAGRVLLRDLTFSRCGDAINILPDVVGVTIEQSRFTGNTIGVRVGATSSAVVVRNSRFRGHEQAAIWASSARTARADAGPRLNVQANRFDDDRLSIAAINVPALIERNEIRGTRDMAVYLFGTRSIVRLNRIEGGVFGVLADSTERSEIVQNEIDGGRTAGILIRSARDTVVVRNRLHSNVYGLAVVFGTGANADRIDENAILASQQDGLYLIGASPLIRRNHIIQSEAAAARVLDFVPWTGPPILSAPRFEENVFRANSLDGQVKGQYRPAREGTQRR